jgi:hypothetical protein
VLTGSIEYSQSTPTNQDILATVSFNKSDVTITSTGDTTYLFTGNGSFTFTFQDSYGNTGSETAYVDWIDKEVPTCSIVYAPNVSYRTDVATLTGCSEPITVTNNGGNIAYLFVRNESFTFTYQDTVGNTGSTTATVNWMSDGGGGGSLSKDNCPNGDFSSSYYDGECDPEDGHPTAEVDDDDALPISSEENEH